MVRRQLGTRLAALLGVIACAAAVVVVEAQTSDTSARAVPLFPLVGHIKPRAAAEIASSPWSVGGETLDRDFAIYDNYKRYLGPIGAKAIRLQAGWAKCEKKAGVYDFAWLDAIVDDARSQGVQPWLEASYGNPIYPGSGGAGLGGGLPKSPEGLAAWDNWVRSLVQHFKDRVTEWEVWNEPDINKGNAADDYADLFVRTAAIIRREQPNSRIYAMALAYKIEFAEKFFERVKQLGKTDLMDAVTVHSYPQNPDDTSTAMKVRALAAKYAPSVLVRQGETGAPSTAATFGALSGIPWTELTQAKYDLRRMLAHRGKDVPYNVFTLMELKYTTAGGGHRWNSKGLLQANEDMTVARPKPAYFAVQNVFAVFDDTLGRIAEYPVTASTAQRLAVDAYEKAAAKQQVVAVWLSGAAPSDASSTTPVDLTFSRGHFTEPVYVDLRTGEVFAIPQANWSRDASGGVTFRQIPVYDSPILIADRAALPLEMGAPR